MSTRFKNTNGDFVCKHCRQYVSAASFLSGVINRNHCPYCLWSRHVDCYAPGDRLSACKEKMKPIGLTIKRSIKKYAPKSQGELMLIHQCTDCGSVSINRVAADDIPDAVYEVYQGSLRMDAQTRRNLEDSGIRVLADADAALVETRLWGRLSSSPGRVPENLPAS